MEQFKVGDWVRELNPLPFAKEVYQLSDSDFYGVGRKSNIYFENIEKWQPKEGDWCWFYDDTEGTPIFGRFYKQDKDFGNCCYPQHQINSPYSYCEPFIGELPSFLKGTI